MAAGFIGGVPTAAGIVYLLIFAGGTSIHMRYFLAAITMFVPLAQFCLWTARYERHSEEHGLFTNALAAEQA